MGSAPVHDSTLFEAVLQLLQLLSRALDSCQLTHQASIAMYLSLARLFHRQAHTVLVYLITTKTHLWPTALSHLAFITTVNSNRAWLKLQLFNL